MINRRKLIIPLLGTLGLLFISIGAATAQNDSSISAMTIEQCYQWSKEHYTFTQQLDLVNKTTAYSLDNAANGNLPQINLNGQATYQSAVTELPGEMPGLDIPTVNKDQYKAYLDVYQPLNRFNTVSNQQNLIRTNGEIEKQQVEIDFQKLKDRINQIYFGTLLINEKNEQLRIIQADIDSALVKVQAAINNGTATLTDKQLLEVEKIALDQQMDENKANQLAFIEMLSTLTGKKVDLNTQLIRPQIQVLNSVLNRPELQLFSLQSQNLAFQNKQLDQDLLPNIGLFGQSGYGRPALNLLSNEFEFYYIGGLKLNWNLSAFYNHKNKKRSLDLANEKIAAQKETFLLNTRLTQSQQSAEIKKYQGLIFRDEQIIAIRQEVVNTAKVQLENGLITTLDYINNLNNLNQAKQTMLLHETQLLLAQQNYKITTGN
ncbi:MAG: TolC family protein [Bacteroidota bacterium]